MRNKKIVVVGATGKVGREILSILFKANFDPKNVTAAASPRSAGTFIKCMDHEICVQKIEDINFFEHNIALFSAGSEVSKVYAPKAAEAGCVVIDNTSYFRMFEDVPLIVPEINFDDIKNYKNQKIIANPNCSTIQMVMVLKPLHDMFGINEVVVSTYQSTSGAGQKGIEELLDQTTKALDKSEIAPNHFKRQIAFNVIPQIDSFTDSSYTKEEIKMMNETKKILGLPELNITATCVRVPIVIGHSVSVFVKFDKDIDLSKAIDSINNFSGVEVVDNPETYIYATPIDTEAKDEVLVSRIRKHPTMPNALSFWCVANNIRKGAALNAFQIAKRLNS